MKVKLLVQMKLPVGTVVEVEDEVGRMWAEAGLVGAFEPVSKPVHTPVHSDLTPSPSPKGEGRTSPTATSRK